ncbi:MAG: hypothetical protein ACXVXE_12105 [Nocardioidaceae bacterium]
MHYYDGYMGGVNLRRAGHLAPSWCDKMMAIAKAGQIPWTAAEQVDEKAGCLAGIDPANPTTPD